MSRILFKKETTVGSDRYVLYRYSGGRAVVKKNGETVVDELKTSKEFALDLLDGMVDAARSDLKTKKKTKASKKSRKKDAGHGGADAPASATGGSDG